jgi:ABC-type multidrug transport system fused ATPase/permease subunit
MVVQSFATELATAGDFVGMAVAIPLISVLTLIAMAVYLFQLNPLLAAVSFAVYPLAVFLIPWLQKRANLENKKRVDASRNLYSKIVEAVSGIHEIQANCAYNVENRKFGAIVDELLKIRIVWNLYRQGIKVVSNFFTNFSPFLIFILGGYLAINGRLELGALVAFLSAQEKVFDPWRELIEFYQSYQEASVSYSRTMEYFAERPDFEIAPPDRNPYRLEGNIEISDLSFTTEEGIRLLDKINLSVNQGEQLALVGFSGSGKSTLALCIGQLFKYTEGHLKIDKQEVSQLSKQDIANNTGFVSQTPFIFDGTIAENLLYGCVAQAEDAADGLSRNLPELDEMIAVIQQTGIFPDILRFSLNAVLERTKFSNLVPPLIRIRKKLRRRLNETLADNVEFFDKQKYLYYSSLAKNLTFGSSNQESFSEKKLSGNSYFLVFLDEVQLKLPLLDLAARLCTQAIGILGNLPPDELFFMQSPIEADELDEYKSVAEHLKTTAVRSLPSLEQQKLLELALRFIPGRHKMITFPEILEQRILKARTRFREKITAEFPEAYSFYRKSEYIYSHSILNNIFFGRLKTTNPRIQDTINEQVVQLLIEEGILETVVEIGMQFQVGSKGDRLSGGQRQKLAIARAFLKNPRILIMDEATSALDNKSQTRIQTLLDTHWRGKATLIAVVHRLDIIKNFDKIGVMKSGKIEEMGSYEELMAKKGLLYELVAGKR